MAGNGGFARTSKKNFLDTRASFLFHLPFSFCASPVCPRAVDLAAGQLTRAPPAQFPFPFTEVRRKLLDKGSRVAYSDNCFAGHAGYALSCRRDPPKTDPSGVATGDKTSVVDAAGNSFV